MGIGFVNGSNYFLYLFTINLQRSHFHSGKFKCSECTCKFLSAAGLINHKKLHKKRSHMFTSVKHSKSTAEVNTRKVLPNELPLVPKRDVEVQNIRNSEQP